MSIDCNGIEIIEGDTILVLHNMAIGRVTNTSKISWAVFYVRDDIQDPHGKWFMTACINCKVLNMDDPRRLVKSIPL